MTAPVRVLIRRLVAIAGWPIRVQWLVRNMAPALGPGAEPSPPPGGQVVGCAWLTRLAFRPSYFPVLVSPGPGEWYNCGCALLRSHAPAGSAAAEPVAMAHAGQRGGTSVFGLASRLDRIASASHRAAGFVTVEDVIGLALLDRFTVVLHRRARGGRRLTARAPAGQRVRRATGVA